MIGELGAAFSKDLRGEGRRRVRVEKKEVPGAWDFTNSGKFLTLVIIPPSAHISLPHRALHPRFDQIGGQQAKRARTASRRSVLCEMRLGFGR